MKDVRWVFEIDDARPEDIAPLMEAWRQRKDDTIALGKGVYLHDLKTGQITPPRPAGCTSAHYPVVENVAPFVIGFVLGALAVALLALVLP